MTVWQNAAGYGEQVYVDLCLGERVIRHGCGNCGEWSQEDRARILECVKQKSKETQHGSRTSVEFFCEKMRCGDIVILRSERFAHGLGIIGRYSYSTKYRSVGPKHWDLQHNRSVEWIWQGTRKLYDCTVPLPKATTLQVVDQTVIDWVSDVVRNHLRRPGRD